MPHTLSTEQGHATVKGHFTHLCELYYNEVVNTTLASTDVALTTIVRSLITQFEQFWCHLSAVGAFSCNDELDDCSTTALEMLWTPYIIADLYQHIQGPVKAGQDARLPSSIGNGEATASPQQRWDANHERMKGEELPRHQGTSNQDVPLAEGARNHGASRLVSQAADEEELRSLRRQDALARSHAWFHIFFEWMQQMDLVDEKTVEMYSVYRADQRTQRIELSRTISALHSAWKTQEENVGYLLAKRRRMRELVAEDGEAAEETGGEEEEALRERALARLKWSIFEACHQLQMSSRELHMLEVLSPEQRSIISKEYQDTMDAVRRGELSLGRHTYTVLPGGRMSVGTVDRPQPVLARDVMQSGGVTMEPGAESSLQALTAQTNPYLFRQQIKNELMKDRNAPTMTLNEFAELEMRDVQRQMADAQMARQRQAEEDERLGPEGVEERQRHKDSAWDNWKDDHPAYGLSNKGNYS